MRSALLCVFFLLIIEESTRATTTGDFKPIPIPLDQWNFEKRDGRVGTLQEAVNTESPPSVAAVPAHYWEDALKHSVYLTLVRDKIDQLIAKGVVVSPDSKSQHYASKEVDDHDLWEKIKKAPFDRINNEDHPSFGDVTIMARGRLLEENGGFRFAEDSPSTDDCSDDKCLKGVKAIWSVKRVRQRDEEISPGRYHYELTFSVTSQLPKKPKTYENPVRTFTVRETPPDIIVAKTQDSQYYQTTRPQTARPQRAIWFHRNIAPNHNQARYNNHYGLDRIFSSFFSDDDPVDSQPRYKPNHYMPPMYQNTPKVGYVGLPSDQHHQKRIMHLPYKPNAYKYVRPPLQAPPLSHIQHHFMDIDTLVNNQHLASPDHRHISSSNIVKTTRPAVLPTPPISSLSAIPNNVSTDIINKSNVNESNIISRDPDTFTTYKMFSKPRPTPIKGNYFPEPIRPPIYNAPPGVFANTEKKPFKPMPPLKLIHPTKQSRRPIDFRPSPQVLDTQFSDPDPDQAFRPILINRTNDTNRFEATDDSKHDKHDRRQPGKKPPKKHEIVKSQRVTTSPPDIITVSSDLEYDFDNDTLEWANLLGSFTKTTPIEYTKKNTEILPEVTTAISVTDKGTEFNKNVTTTERYENKVMVTTTNTPAPKKRTRPPHKFVKQDKIKKHKRVTTTKAPEKTYAKQTSDLTPQASSSLSGTNNSWKSKNKTLINTTTSTTTVTSTTTQDTTTSRPSTTSTQIPTTFTVPTQNASARIQSFAKPTQERSKNRFRQSTLMYKGTSVKHDRWSLNQGPEKKITAATSVKYPPRRKGSNFQGYRTLTSKHPKQDDKPNENVSEFNNPITTERNRHDDFGLNSQSMNTSLSTQTAYEDTGDRYNIDSEPTLGYTEIDEDKYDHKEDDIERSPKRDDEHSSNSEDQSEFIFGVSSTIPSDKTNEVSEEDSTVTEAIIATSHSVSKNKTRCKKKKHQHLSPTLESVTEDELTETATTETTTKSSSNLDILDELLGSLTYDSTTAISTRPTELNEEESENHEKYLNIDEEFEDFLDTLGERNRHTDDREEEEYEEDEKLDKSSDVVSPFDNDDVNESTRHTSDKEYDEDYHERSYSLLELMAME